MTAWALPAMHKLRSGLRWRGGRSRGLRGGWATAVALLAPSAASACPTCSEAIRSDPAALAFQWSTLFMLAMPYALVIAVGGGLLYAYWSAARVGESSPDQTMTWPLQGPERGGEQ